MTPSQLGSACRPLNASSASMVSLRRRSQPASGKWPSIAARHSGTGRRQVASRSHGSGVISRPRSPRAKIVPRKSSRTGTSPPSSAWKYLAALTSRS